MASCFGATVDIVHTLGDNGLTESQQEQNIMAIKLQVTLPSSGITPAQLAVVSRHVFRMRASFPDKKIVISIRTAKQPPTSKTEV